MDNMINIANQIIVYSVCYTLIFVAYGYVFYYCYSYDNTNSYVFHMFRTSYCFYNRLCNFRELSWMFFC